MCKKNGEDINNYKIFQREGRLEKTINLESIIVWKVEGDHKIVGYCFIRQCFSIPKGVRD